MLTKDTGVNKPDMVLTDGVNKSGHGVNRNTDRHKAGYMRDYMRKRRAG